MKRRVTKKRTRRAKRDWWVRLGREKDSHRYIYQRWLWV